MDGSLKKRKIKTRLRDLACDPETELSPSFGSIMGGKWSFLGYRRELPANIKWAFLSFVNLILYVTGYNLYLLMMLLKS